jgi:nucleoside-triphosphatase THEP1
MNIIISGAKHFGKTSVAEKLVDRMKRAGIPIGGVLCIDDKVKDIETGETKTFLYEQEIPNAQRIGHHYISNPVISFAEKNIRRAIKSGLYAIIDEYGKLELREGGFHNITSECIGSNKCIISVRDINVEPFLERFKKYDFKVFSLTEENRAKLHEQIFSYIFG